MWIGVKYRLDRTEGWIELTVGGLADCGSMECGSSVCGGPPFEAQSVARYVELGHKSLECVYEECLECDCEECV